MEEIVTMNEKGGKQHHTGTRAQALFPNALIELSKLRYQAKFEMGYEDDNYLKIEKEEHIGRALNHIFTYLANKGDAVEELTHASCRVMMALEEVLLERTLESKKNIIGIHLEDMNRDECRHYYADDEEEALFCLKCKKGILKSNPEYKNAPLLWEANDRI